MHMKKSGYIPLCNCFNGTKFELIAIWIYFSRNKLQRYVQANQGIQQLFRK